MVIAGGFGAACNVCEFSGRTFEEPINEPCRMRRTLDDQQQYLCAGTRMMGLDLHVTASTASGSLVVEIHPMEQNNDSTRWASATPI